MYCRQQFPKRARRAHLSRWPATLLSVGIVACCATLTSFSAVLAQEQQTARLEQSGEIERALNGGETHEYQIGLLAGQFLHLVVEQKGIDVTVTLSASDGKKIATVDSLNAEYGPEPLVAIAEISGSYRVVIAPSDKDSLPGRYKIRIIEVRSPAPGDAEHIAAERSIERATEIESTRRKWDDAIAKLQEALPYYETVGAQDAYRHGLVLFTIGYLEGQQSRVRESIASYLAALPLFQSAGDPIMEARTRNNLGGEYHDWGDSEKALQYHKEALSMVPSEQLYSFQAPALNNLGVLYAERGDWTAALEAYERAASNFATWGKWSEQAKVRRNVAYAYRAMNEPEQALRFLEQARQIMQLKSVNDPTLQAEILTNRAEVLLSQGQSAEALESCEQALQLRHDAGDSRREGDTLSVMGTIYHALQRPEEAQQAFEEALGKQQQAGYQLGAFRTLLGMARLALSQQKSEEARTKIEQALKIAVSLNCGECKVQAEFGLARAQRALGNLAESLQQARNSVEDMEKLHAGISSSAFQASFLGSHEEMYELYMGLSLDDPKGSAADAFQISERGRARSFLEILSGMGADLGKEYDPQLAKREQVIRNELASSAAARLNLWQQKDQNPDQARGRVLTTKEVEDRIQQLEAQLNSIEAEKARTNKRYAALTQPQYLTVEQVQKDLLDDQTLFLEYYLGNEKSYLWAIAQDDLAIYELPPRSQIEAAVSKFCGLLQKHTLHDPLSSELTGAASDLSKLVLGPVQEKLQNQRLVIAADGVLQHVPFAALNRPGVAEEYEPLIVAHEIVNVPSASALAVERQFLAHRTPAERNLAILADPVFSTQDPRSSSKPGSRAHPPLSLPLERLLEHVQPGASAKSIPRLPFTAVEADKIFAMVPSGESMKAVGFDANRGLATSPELGRYKYLHFATHGYMDSKHPELSALVLSLVDKNGDFEDGFLRLQDIYNLRLHADLVVLSACETGLGREIRGEGLIGLTRGFMYAGAARVLVSLWSVSDQGTSELMPRFYESMLKQAKTPAAALREAQIAMFNDKQWRDPYYWAAFTLQGEWK